MRPLVLLVSLLSALSTFAEPFRIEPKAPTSTSGVVLVVDWVWNGCLPRSAVVTRNDQSIDVLWTVPRGFVCVAAIIPWKDRVALGALEPGKYDVTLRVDSLTGLQTIGTKTFVVADGDPAFEFSPSAIGLNGGFVGVNSIAFCVKTPAEIPKVLVDGVPIQYQVDPCSLVLFMPPHAAGPVDITVFLGDTPYTVRSTFRYLDEHATPDDAVFERVLIPVFSNGPGAFGSQWATQAMLRNLSNQALRFFSDVARPAGCAAECLIGPSGFSGLFEFGEHPRGLVLFVPRNIANDIHYGLLVRDTSRDDSAWGTELRVVREKDARTGPMVLENVPFDARYRVALRLYAIDGGGGDVKLTAVTPDRTSASATVRLEGCDAPPCNSAEPGFGSFDVRALFPTLLSKSRITIYIEGDGRPHWALASVTNNTTQHVTVISPQ